MVRMVVLVVSERRRLKTEAERKTRSDGVGEGDPGGGRVRTGARPPPLEKARGTAPRGASGGGESSVWLGTLGHLTGPLLGAGALPGAGFHAVFVPDAD